MTPGEEMLLRISQLWIVAKCKCSMRRSKSTTHIDCMQIDKWILDEIIQCARFVDYRQQSRPSSTADSIIYAESIDSLQPDTSQQYSLQFQAQTNQYMRFRSN